MTDNERKAWESVSTPVKLKKRLLEAKSVLRNEYRKLFSAKSRVDFINKMMISDDGKYALVWKLRERPDLPERYDNQQTSRGGVGLYNYKNITVPFSKNPRPRRNPINESTLRVGEEVLDPNKEGVYIVRKWNYHNVTLENLHTEKKKVVAWLEFKKRYVSVYEDSL